MRPAVEEGCRGQRRVLGSKLVWATSQQRLGRSSKGRVEGGGRVAARSEDERGEERRATRDTGTRAAWAGVGMT